MIVLDASAVIALVEAGDAHHEAAVRLIAGVGRTTRSASVVSVAEMLVSYTAAGRLADGEETLRRLGIVEVPLASDAAPRLAALRVSTRLKLPDCCVLLAAQDAGADTIATFDERLADAARAHGLRVAHAE